MQYPECLGHFLTTNSISNGDHKRAVPLSVIGPKVYQLLESLMAPDKLGDRSCTVRLVKVMTGGGDDNTTTLNCAALQISREDASTG